MAVCGCEIDHPHIDIDKYDDGSFDKLFEECKADTEDHDDTLAFKLAEKRIALALVLRLGNICRPKRSNDLAFFMSADHLAVHVPKKKRGPRSGHGFFAKKTPSDQRDNQQGAEAKSPSSTGSSTDQFANPISMYYDGFYHRFGHTTTTSSSDQEDDHKKARKNKEKKQISGRKRCFKRAAADDDEDGEKRSKKKRKICNVQKVDYSKLQDVPNFSEEVRARIGKEGAKDFKLRITKQLFNTDMSPHHDRFSMPVRQILDECGDLLNEEEKAIVCDKDANGLEVKLIELGLGKDKNKQVENDMRMKEWNMNSISYALRSGWKGILRRNKGKALKGKHIVQVYSFRSCDGKLGLVLIKVGDHQNGFFREGPFVSRPDDEDDEEVATELPTVDNNPSGASTSGCQDPKNGGGASTSHAQFGLGL